MTTNEIMDLINRSLFADLGFMDSNGRPGIRRVFCVWHRGLKRHLISTNTSSHHVQCLMKNDEACLYFADNDRFSGICLSGKAVIHFEREYRELLWHDGDEKYYPKGVNDEDYCVVEFVADEGRFYRFDGKGNLSEGDMDRYDAGRQFEDGYSKVSSMKNKAE